MEAIIKRPFFTPVVVSFVRAGIQKPYKLLFVNLHLVQPHSASTLWKWFLVRITNRHKKLLLAIPKWESK